MWNRILERLKDTIIGETLDTFTDYYKNNRRMVQITLIICLIISMGISGWISGYAALGQNKIETYQSILIPYYAIRYGLILTAILFILVTLLVFRLISILGKGYTRDKERNYNISKEGTQGTAHMMNEAEIDKTFITGTIEELDGDILGYDPANKENLFAIREQYGINRNMAVVGAPGSGKSRCLVINMCMQMMRRGESMIITDPKGELFTYLSEIGKKYGYKIRLLSFNPLFMEHSDSCNYMRFIKGDTLRAQSFANTIIQNTNNDEKGFWPDSMLNLLTAVILYIDMSNDIKPEDKNLGKVYEMLSQNDVFSLEAKFSNLQPGHPALGPFSIYKNGDKTVKGNTLTSLGIRLQVFNSAIVKKVTGNDEISMTEPGESKCIYFIGSSDQDTSMSFLVALFFTLLYQELVALADSQTNKKLNVSVNMVLDEFANIGVIPSFQKRLSTVRSRGINTTIIIQDLCQLELMYPQNSWRTIMNDCSLHVLLQTNDMETATYFSERSGDQTVLQKSKRYEESAFDIIKIHPNYTVTESETQRPVLTKHEILTMDITDIFIVTSTRNVIKLKKYDFSRNPMSKEIEEVLPVQHVPQWKLREFNLLEPDADYDTLLINCNDNGDVSITKRDQIYGMYYKGEKEEKKKTPKKPYQKSMKLPQNNTLFGELSGITKNEEAEDEREDVPVSNNTNITSADSNKNIVTENIRKQAADTSGERLESSREENKTSNKETPVSTNDSKTKFIFKDEPDDEDEFAEKAEW